MILLSAITTTTIHCINSEDEVSKSSSIESTNLKLTTNCDNCQQQTTTTSPITIQVSDSDKALREISNNEFQEGPRDYEDYEDPEEDSRVSSRS